MREIKFRAYEKATKYSASKMFFVGVLELDELKAHDYYNFYDGYSGTTIDYTEDKNAIIMQFTGFLDKNGKEIYEGDIFRVEEVDEEICDQCDGCGWQEGGKSLKTNCERCNGTGSFISDKIYYLVITWVKEWGMFCTLTVDNEYFDYINEGIKALDEPMFWTYTLEDTDSKKFFLCGNIHENPELLNIQL